MLNVLSIKNVAVIDSVSVCFKDGFNILTGETGAGKSILIDSINLVLGSKASKNLIRKGKDSAEVSAMFFVESNEVINKLESLGIMCEDNEVLISRTVFANGRNVCRINRNIVNTSMLKEAGRLLCNIHGQHENNTLADSATHINYLDGFAGLQEDVLEYNRQLTNLKDIENKMNSLKIDESEKLKKIDFLNFQKEEIEKSNLKIGEEEELIERKNILLNAEKIITALDASYEMLYNMRGSAYENLCGSENSMLAISGLDQKYKELYNRITEAEILTRDISDEIRSLKEGFEYSEGELNEVFSRLDIINGLKRRYNMQVEDIIEYKNKIDSELEALLNNDEEIIKLEGLYKSRYETLKELAKNISKKRKTAGKKLTELIKNELCDLDMGKMEFDVLIEQADSFTKNGCDKVTFLIAPNPGEGKKPLDKIASGGEMARIMLALKSVFSKTETLGTMIFDEIDTGVSGRAAQKIAEKLYCISKGRQVLVITHLPQISAMGDCHFLISKTSDDLSTTTDVCEIEDDARVSEIARIIGGREITALTLDNAKQMIDLAREFKEGLV